MTVHRIIGWWDDHQVLLYMAAILVGAAVGLAAPQLAPILERSIEPVLILLLFATFAAIVSSAWLLVTSPAHAA